MVLSILARGRLSVLANRVKDDIPKKEDEDNEAKK